MKRGIVAIDTNRGLADDEGIPWKIPGDLRYFRDKTRGHAVLMGYGTYADLDSPLVDRTNYVATHRDEDLRDGFTKVSDPREFLQNYQGDVWNIGGAALLASTLDLLDELYVTQIQQDWHTTKIIPEFQDDFTLVSESETKVENGTPYTFQIWKHN